MRTSFAAARVCHGGAIVTRCGMVAASCAVHRVSSRRAWLLAHVAGGVLLAPSAFAQRTLTWNATGTTNNFWDEATNWSPNGVPGTFNFEDSIDTTIIRFDAPVRTVQVRSFVSTNLTTNLRFVTGPGATLAIQPAAGSPNAQLNFLADAAGRVSIGASGTGLGPTASVGVPVIPLDVRATEFDVFNESSATLLLARGLSALSAHATFRPGVNGSAGAISLGSDLTGSSSLGAIAQATLTGGTPVPAVGSNPGLLVFSFDVLRSTLLTMRDNAVLRKSSSGSDIKPFAAGAGIVVGSIGSPVGATIRCDFDAILGAPIAIFGPLTADIRANATFSNTIAVPSVQPAPGDAGRLIKIGAGPLWLTRQSIAGTQPIWDVREGQLVFGFNYESVTSQVLNQAAIRIALGTAEVSFNGPVTSNRGTFLSVMPTSSEPFNFHNYLAITGNADTFVRSGRVRNLATIAMPLHKGGRPRIASDKFVIENATTLDLTSALPVATPLGSYPLVLGTNANNSVAGAIVSNRRYDGTMITVPDQTNVPNIVANVTADPSLCPPLAGGAAALNTPLPGTQHFGGPINPIVPGECPPTTVPPSADFTLEAWVRPDAGANMTIMSHGHGSNVPDTNFIFQLNQQGRNLALYIHPQWLSVPGLIIPSGVWSHVAVTVSNANGLATAQFYLNGVAAGAPVVGLDQRAALPACWDVFVGRQGTSCNCNFFRGGMDEVRFWNGLRTPQQIQNHRFDPIAPNDPQATALRYYFRFDDLAGLTTRNHAVGANAANASFTIANTSTAQSPWAVAIPCRNCASDLNADGVVDDLDFQVFVVQYDLLDCFDPIMSAGCVGDINNDLVVDDLDFQMFTVAYDALVCP